jgi:hypothetical protein
MAIQLTNGNGGQYGYNVGLVGDGTSMTMSVDYYDQIAADNKIPNKTPTGIFQVSVDQGVTPTASLSGTVVTFTWSTAPASNVIVNLGIALTFNP